MAALNCILTRSWIRRIPRNLFFDQKITITMMMGAKMLTGRMMNTIYWNAVVCVCSKMRKNIWTHNDDGDGEYGPTMVMVMVMVNMAPQWWHQMTKWHNLGWKRPCFTMKPHWHQLPAPPHWKANISGFIPGFPFIANSRHVQRWGKMARQKRRPQWCSRDLQGSHDSRVLHLQTCRSPWCQQVFPPNLPSWEQDRPDKGEEKGFPWKLEQTDSYLWSE